MRKLSPKILVLLLIVYALPGLAVPPVISSLPFPVPNDTLTKTDFRVVKVTLPVGRGSKNERLTSFRISQGPYTNTITRIDLDLNGTDQLIDISSIRIYFTGNQKRLNLSEAQLFGQATQVKAKKLSVFGRIVLNSGENYFWVTADIHGQATEGNHIEASVLNYNLLNGTSVRIPAATGNRTVLLQHQLLFSGGDWNSNNYRIPAVVTAADGSLVTATDKRWNNPWDLPRHIDLVIRRSTDRGTTWSEPFTLAGENDNTGFGDATLIFNQKNGDLICLFASGQGFLHSSTNKLIRTYQSVSHDNGIHWSTPVDITSQIYGPESNNPITQNWQGAFVSSGNATQCRNGRIIAALVVRETDSKAISTFVMYSDDNGRGWQVSTNRAVFNGNEAKIVERNNGDLVISVRNKGFRIFNISTDKGLNWGTPYYQTDIIDPSCNGSFIKYTSKTEGWDTNRLLHSIPYSSERENLTILMSYDEGSTWPVRKTIFAGKSAYSSLTILPDGSIGMYYEVGEYETYQLYFARFSLKWLSDGADEWRTRINYLNELSEFELEPSPGLLVYPNPATDQITLSGSWPEGSLLTIYNTSGVLMQTRYLQHPAQEISLALPNYKPGLYRVSVGPFGAWFVVN